MKAIDTCYNGYLFRSRLEARWAVFFDALGLAYCYEPEGFDLGEAGWYLPDFWLPSLSWWVEVKPESPPAEDAAKLQAFAEGGCRLALCVGELPNPETLECGGPPWGVDWYEQGITILDSGGDNGYAWCVCETCGSVGLQYEARSDRLPCKRCYHCNDVAWQCSPENGGDPALHAVLRENYVRWGLGPWLGPSGHSPCPEHGYSPAPGCPCSFHGDRGNNGDHPRIRAAYRAARSARFEHGEKPGRPR